MHFLFLAYKLLQTRVGGISILHHKLELEVFSYPDMKSAPAWAISRVIVYMTDVTVTKCV